MTMTSPPPSFIVKFSFESRFTRHVSEMIDCKLPITLQSALFYKLMLFHSRRSVPVSKSLFVYTKTSS